MSAEKFVKPDFIGTPDAMITKDGVFPLPQAWAELTHLDVKAYWREQDRRARHRQARLDACMHEEEDDGSHQVSEEIFEEHDRLMFGDE